jgi:serine/threonine protein kinase
MKDVSEARIAEYVIQEELAARSTELAYRTTHRVLPRCARVAILNPIFVGVRRAEAQLMREACILETLHHSGVPRVFECGVHGDRPWIATEYIDGTSLDAAVASRPLPIGDALAIVRDAAEVLAHAHHRGVVHRNLTPGSLVRTPARGFPICITGWGDAELDAAGHDSAVPRAIDDGARLYRAPELATDVGSDDPADVFALGAILFEATTRSFPAPLRKLPGLPVAAYRLLEGMLSRDPDDRPTAQGVCAEASRLAEVFADGDGAIEEVEVELVDISQCPAQMSRLGWMPDRRSFRGPTLTMQQPRRKMP